MADSYPPYVSPAPEDNAPPRLLSPDQLNNLVAPVALYPDELLGEVLAASTYPLEVVEAQQWLQQNRGLQGSALVEAARQQDWDPSVQMLVAFPDAVALLNRDIRWTTDLGNAFLAQQSDVMNAVQTLRFRAQNNGRLTSTPQQVVSTQAQGGQYAVRIEPANPQVLYPPNYDPAYVWGPPVVGAYPPVYAPAPYYSGGYPGYGYSGYGGGGYGFGSGINITGLLSGLMSWSGWGWALGWFTHSLSLASVFFNLLGGLHFGGGGGYGGGIGYGGGGGYGGGAAFTLWAHNPAHRLGVAYPRAYLARNPGVIAAARVGSSRMAASASPASASRFLASPAVRSNYSSSSRSNFSPSTAGIANRGGEAFRSSTAQPSRIAPQVSSPRYMAQNSSAQHFSEPKYSAPKYSAPKYSTPKFSAPKAPKAQHFSAPKSSGGGHSGKSSHKR